MNMQRDIYQPPPQQYTKADNIINNVVMEVPIPINHDSFFALTFSVNKLLLF
jgi:hypothetical protein